MSKNYKCHFFPYCVLLPKPHAISFLPRTLRDLRLPDEKFSLVCFFFKCSIFYAPYLERPALARTKVVCGSPMNNSPRQEYFLMLYFFCTVPRETHGSLHETLSAHPRWKVFLVYIYFYRCYIFFCPGSRETRGSPLKLGSHCRSDQLDDPDCPNFHDRVWPNSWSDLFTTSTRLL